VPQYHHRDVANFDAGQLNRLQTLTLPVEAAVTPAWKPHPPISLESHEPPNPSSVSPPTSHFHLSAGDYSDVLHIPPARSCQSPTGREWAIQRLFFSFFLIVSPRLFRTALTNMTFYCIPVHNTERPHSPLRSGSPPTRFIQHCFDRSPRRLDLLFGGLPAMPAARSNLYLLSPELTRGPQPLI